MRDSCLPLENLLRVLHHSRSYLLIVTFPSR
jgi:hypothetical protein